MQSNSPQMMAIYRAHAANLEPIQRPEYKIVHTSQPRIQVPRGYLPIYVAQFNRGVRNNGDNRLNHWAIFVPTATQRGVGNWYEIAGSLREGYRTQYLVHNRHPHWKDERGMHLVGYVAPEHLETLETRFALIQVKQGRPDWNCHTWVVEALQGLNGPNMFAVQMDYGQFYQQMELVEGAWNVGDA